MSRLSHLLLGPVLALAASLAVPQMAAAQTMTPGDAVEAELLPGWRLPDGRHMTALRLRLAPGWKTYWRSPGEGGIAPRFTWRESRNLDRVVEHWPRPAVYVDSGLQSLGFKNELILPLEIVPADDTAPVRLRADVDIGVCEQVCMPVSLHLSAELGPGGTRDARIVAALAQVPVPSREAGVRLLACRLSAIPDGLRLRAEIATGDIGAASEAVVFEVPDPNVWISTAHLSREGGVLVAESDILGLAGGLALDRSSMLITLIGTERAVEIRGCRAD